MAAVTEVTPGRAASSSSARRKRVMLSSSSYPFNWGEMLKATMPSVRIPSSIRLTFMRLLAKSPAPTRRAMERAIWTVTREVRKRAAERDPEGCPEKSFSAVTRSGRVLWRAG